MREDGAAARVIPARASLRPARPLAGAGEPGSVSALLASFCPLARKVITDSEFGGLAALRLEHDLSSAVAELAPHRSADQWHHARGAKASLQLASIDFQVRSTLLRCVTDPRAQSGSNLLFC
jgi:hypothetical protein